MGDASYVQPSFLGGEWSQAMQGRMDNPKYPTAMALCRNNIPMAEGSCTRRGGSRFSAHTKAGAAARLLSFAFNQAQPFYMEFSDRLLRFYSNGHLVMAAERANGGLNGPRIVTSISAATPAIIGVNSAHGYATNDTVIFPFVDAVNPDNGAQLANRQFLITVTDSTHFSIRDALTGAAIVGSTITFNAGTGTRTVGRVLELVPPYTGTDWKQLRTVQNETAVYLLHPNYETQVIQVLTAPTYVNGYANANFTVTTDAFEDGPYFDPFSRTTTDGGTIGMVAQPTGTTGAITFFIYATTWSASLVYAKGDYVTDPFDNLEYQCQTNNVWNKAPHTYNLVEWKQVGFGECIHPGTGFSATDIGRHIRILSQPAFYDPTVDYAVGDPVSFRSNYYIAIAANDHTNPMSPDIPTIWQLAPQTATWTWGKVTAVTDRRTATVTLGGGPLLYGTTIYLWRAGLYSGSTTFPTCGTFQEGRLWLGGAVDNRFDASMTNRPDSWNPTGPDGTVADDNAISYTVESSDANPIFFMAPDRAGILMGTQGGEWLIQASTLGDPFTPTSIQAKRVTKYVGANMEPLSIGGSLIFPQLFGRKLFEYTADYYGRAARDIAEPARHLTGSQFVETAYQHENVPIVWACFKDGTLAGCTYKRESPFAETAPEFSAWHSHRLGSSRVVESVAVGPPVNPGTVTSLSDNLTMVTSDGTTRHVEVLSDTLEETSGLLNSFFVDNGVVPSGAVVSGGNVIFYGLWNLNGKTASIFCGGLDLGDFAISNGQVSVPLLTVPLFNETYFASITGGDYGSLLTNFKGAGGTVYSIPCAIGFTYTSRGQVLRPVAPAQAGAQNGPAFAKTRRSHMFGALLLNAQKVSIGTDVSALRAIQFKSKGRTQALTDQQLFSGLTWDTLQDDYTFDSMPVWEVSRPFPCTMLAIGAFLQTQDR